MARIREDLVGVVSVGGLSLPAGAVIPDGVTVGDHVLAPEPVVVREKPEAPVQAPRKPRARKSEG